MAWQAYQKQFETRKMDESHFVLGIDLGNAMSSIAYFDVLRQAPEVIDMSGGYGKPSAPTVLQFSPDTQEWVFGEYAVLNQGLGNEQIFRGLLERLGKNESVEVNGEEMSAAHILGLYCKELVAMCKSLNPKAEIAGIVAAVPSDMNAATQADYLAAFREAGMADDLIALVPDRECILHRHYSDGLAAPEKVLLLDFGSRALRGGIYDVRLDADGIAVDCVSSLFDETIGVEQVNARVQEWFTDFYCEQAQIAKDALTKQTLAQLSVFAYQNKDLLFRKAIGAKPIKLYYNFAYPPMQQTVSAADVQAVIAPFAEAFAGFLKDVFAKTLRVDDALRAGDIQTVLCTGGGFEMLWARAFVQEAFRDSKVVFFKNAKGVTAEGASLMAAVRMGVIPPRSVRLTDRHMLAADIGVQVQRWQEAQFVPLAERFSFWWQRRDPVQFLLNEPTGGRETAIELFRREADGTVRPIASALLDGLPERPAGTTKLAVSLQFDAYDKLRIAVKDVGFGELFPKTEFEKIFLVQI